MTTLLRAGRLETDGETAACAGIRKPCIAPSAATPPRNARRRMLISLVMLSPLNQLSTVANFHRSSFVIVHVTTASATYSMAAVAYFADSSRTFPEVREVARKRHMHRSKLLQLIPAVYRLEPRTSLESRGPLPWRTLR